jgi:hypothetical protein
LQFRDFVNAAEVFTHGDDGWAKTIQGLTTPLGPLHLGSFFDVPQNRTKYSLILQI